MARMVRRRLSDTKQTDVVFDMNTMDALVECVTGKAHATAAAAAAAADDTQWMRHAFGRLTFLFFVS
jgi:hypothetical protein